MLHQSHSRTYAYLTWHLSNRLSRQSLLRLLDTHDVSYHHSCSLSGLRRLSKKHITFLQKGKRVAGRPAPKRYCEPSAERRHYRKKRMNAAERQRRAVNAIRREWPKTLSAALKEKLIRAFRRKTSSVRHRSVICASCGESTPAQRQVFGFQPLAGPPLWQGLEAWSGICDAVESTEHGTDGQRTSEKTRLGGCRSRASSIAGPSRKDRGDAW